MQISSGIIRGISKRPRDTSIFCQATPFAPGAPISTSFQFDIIPGNSPGKRFYADHGDEEPSILPPLGSDSTPCKITGRIRFDNSITIISPWPNSWSASWPSCSFSSFNFFSSLSCNSWKKGEVETIFRFNSSSIFERMKYSMRVENFLSVIGEFYIYEKMLRLKH